MPKTCVLKWVQLHCSQNYSKLFIFPAKSWKGDGSLPPLFTTCPHTGLPGSGSQHIHRASGRPSPPSHAALASVRPVTKETSRHTCARARAHTHTHTHTHARTHPYCPHGPASEKMQEQEDCLGVLKRKGQSASAAEGRQGAPH